MKLPRLAGLKGPIASGTLRTTPVLGLRVLVQAGTLLVVARMLGPEQFGAFAGIAALALMMGTLATFGTHTVLLAEVSKDAARRHVVLRFAVPFTLLGGSALLIAYLLLGSLVVNAANVSVATLILIGAAEILLQPLFTLPAYEHLALGRVARSQLLQILPLALRLSAAVTVFLLHVDDPLAAYAWSYLAASLIALAAATRTMPARWPSIRRWRLPNRTELRYAAGYAVLNVTAIGPAELDKTMATKLLPAAASGLYAAGTRVIGAATLPVIAMMLSALPRLFREGVEQPQRTKRLLRWIFAAALGYSMVLAAVLWVVAPVFVWLFGPKYDGIEHTIHWLVLAVPALALRITAGTVLSAIGKPWVRVGFEATGIGILILASVILVARFGTVGMPFALICSEWGMAVLGCTLTHLATKSKAQPQAGVSSDS